MNSLALIALLTSALPWWRAWRALRHTSLAHALVWTAVAWLAWVVVALAGESPTGRYLALALTGCAGMAVLGARRPGVAAWNFVVLGLLSVLLLSWAEGMLLGKTVQLGELRASFLAATAATAVLNYLPTRLAPAAVLLGLGCGLELWGLLDAPARAQWVGDDSALSILLIGLSPWAAWAALAVRRQHDATTFDRLWRSFRDAYGLVWGQRVREQFNNSAFHTGLPVELRWSGLTATTAPLSPAVQDECLQTLTALLKRFGMLAKE